MPLTPGQQRDADAREVNKQIRRARDREMLLNQLQAGIHVQHDVPLFAHCGDPVMCNDEQIPVVGTKTVTNLTHADLGGDSHAIERSWEDLDFANDEDRKCKRCGGHMHLSDQVRPYYGPLSGTDPEALVKLARNLIVGDVKPTPAAIFEASKPPEDDRVAALEAELAEIKALVASNGHAQEPEKIRGVRRRGERFEALIYRTESEDGRQRSLGTFDSAEEAVAARDEALS